MVDEFQNARASDNIGNYDRVIQNDTETEKKILQHEYSLKKLLIDNNTDTQNNDASSTMMRS